MQETVLLDVLGFGRDLSREQLKDLHNQVCCMLGLMGRWIKRESRNPDPAVFPADRPKETVHDSISRVWLFTTSAADPQNISLSCDELL